MKTLDQAVIELNGVLPDVSNDCDGAGKFVVMKMPMSRNDKSVGIFFDDDDDLLFTGSGEEFQQRAKELGFINGYRWGVEYKTDGKRPDLPDDIEIKWQAVGVKEWWPKHDNTTAGELDWNGEYAVYSFKITDQRYKPADMSYLEKPALEPVPEEENWYTYEMNVANQPAPVGTKVLVDCHHQGMKKGIVIGAFQRWNWIDVQGFAIETFDMILVKPLDHDRKAKSERKRVVDAAYDEAIKAGCVDFGQRLNHLYDKGFLKLPE